MSTNKKTLLLVGYVGILALMLACMGIAVGSSNVEEGSLQLDNGTVEVQDQNGDWVPVAGTSTFEVVGKLESMDPWTVAGKTLKTNDMTQIEDGLQVGDLVRVRGIILEDGTWLASSIERADDQTQPVIILIGKVTSIDPWVVNGITLNVTDQTDIQGTITPGMLVRVEILLLPDGTWQVLSISPLGDVTEIEGCATVIATVVAVNGDQVQFLGWPTITLSKDVKIEGGQSLESGQGKSSEGGEGDEDENNNEQQGGTVILSAGQVVLAVVCNSEEGQVVIVQIIILNTNDGGDSTSNEGEKVLVCHKPGKNQHTLSLPPAAVPAHLGHGDKLGACP